MQDYGVNAYRLSLAWTRIVPSGKKGGEVNAKGVEGYRQQLKALRAAGIVSLSWNRNVVYIGHEELTVSPSLL